MDGWFFNTDAESNKTIESEKVGLNKDSVQSSEKGSEMLTYEITERVEGYSLDEVLPNGSANNLNAGYRVYFYEIFGVNGFINGPVAVACVCGIQPRRR